jgi:hypothetical protein
VKKPILINPNNGEAASTLSPAQQECIKLLEDALDSARQGDIWSCILVACGPSDFGTAMAGSDAPRLNLGLDVAKDLIKSRVTGGGRDTVLRR